MCARYGRLLTRAIVGAGEQGVGHSKAERPGGLEIDHQLALGRCLHRQIGRLFALEDAIDVSGRAAALIKKIRPIRDQATVGDEGLFVVDRAGYRIAVVQSALEQPSHSGCSLQF